MWNGSAISSWNLCNKLLHCLQLFHVRKWAELSLLHNTFLTQKLSTCDYLFFNNSRNEDFDTVSKSVQNNSIQWGELVARSQCTDPKSFQTHFIQNGLVSFQVVNVCKTPFMLKNILGNININGRVQWAEKLVSHHYHLTSHLTGLIERDSFRRQTV